MKKQSFAGKTVIVVGGTGSIGAEIVRQLIATKAKQIRIFSRDEHKQWELAQELKDKRLRFLIGDIRDKDRLDFALDGVDICFHAAAMKHVPACEYNPFEAMKTNVIGTQNVIDSALRHNIDKVIAISTDKAVNPSSVLGASKLMMERLIVAANVIGGTRKTRFSAVRFGNVLSSRGSVMSLWIHQINTDKPVTITDERATRFFMKIPEAVQLVFSAAELMHGGEIFVLKMERKLKIVDFARDVAEEHAPGKKVTFSYIGLRPGEKLHEELMTEDESHTAIEIGSLFVIPRHDPAQKKDSYKILYRGARKAKPGSYRSDT